MCASPRSVSSVLKRRGLRALYPVPGNVIRRKNCGNVDRGAGSALAPLTCLGAILFANGDARTLKDFAGDGSGHFVDRHRALCSAPCVELAALDVVLLNTSTQIGGDRRARDKAQIAVGLFTDEAAGARLRQRRILRLRHRHGSRQR